MKQLEHYLGLSGFYQLSLPAATSQVGKVTVALCSESPNMLLERKNNGYSNTERLSDIVIDKNRTCQSVIPAMWSKASLGPELLPPRGSAQI